MRKKDILFVWFLIGIVTLGYAQENKGSASFRFVYQEDFIINPQKMSPKEDILHLDVINGQSAFYSKWSQAQQHLRDSLLKQGRNLNDILRAESQLPKSVQKEVVYKNFPKKGKLTFTDQMLKSFKYEEEMTIPQWTISDEKKEILGYPCQKAETEYYGRKWTVWFTSAIPLSDGPWKLCGLPGMILEAKDSESYFHFICVGMENLKENTIQIPKKNYIECSHKEYIELRRLKTEDLSAFSERIKGEKGIVNIKNPNKKIGFPFLYLEK